MLGVLLAQDGLFCRNVPVNAQRIIQNADTSVRFRMIEVVTLVLEDGRFTQYGKTVRKTARHKKNCRWFSSVSSTATCCP